MASQTHTVPLHSLNIISWNVRGMLNKIKRGAVLYLAKRYSADVLLLQETHLQGTKAPCLSRYGYTTIYHSGFSRGARGTAILIHRRVPLQATRHWTDQGGRYTILTGTLFQEPITIGSLYAPPPLSHTFIDKFTQLWGTLPGGLTVLGGDWNDVMTPHDRWRALPQSASPSVSKLNILATTLGWTDTWRALHPTEAGFTFASTVHNTLSRLDYLFIPHTYGHRILRAVILPRGLSDHSPIQLTISLLTSRAPYRWRMSPWLLKDAEYQEMIHKSSIEYFSLNAGTTQSPLILWEALKPTIRGADISYCTGEKRRKLEHITYLEDQQRALQDSLVHKSNAGTQRTLLHIQRQLHQTLMDTAKEAGLATQHRIYHWGDKSGQMLRLCQAKVAPAQIPLLRSPTGALHTSPTDIAQALAAVYADLYSCHDTVAEPLIDDFLTDIPPKRLSDT